MRFGVLRAKSISIDNAVMRSKAKFVAPNKWTASGSTSNANREWDEATGVFVINPDPTEAENLARRSRQQFRRNQLHQQVRQGFEGLQKIRQFRQTLVRSLRYLQGLAPTADFYQAVTLANGDGFPMITSWDDPVLYSCQKNFVMGMGDTHT